MSLRDKSFYDEIEDVVAFNCKRCSTLPEAEQKAVEEILEAYKKPLPRSVNFIKGQNQKEGNGAPLCISTSAFGDEGACVVKLMASCGEEIVVSFGSGKSIEINVGYGTYECKYACGKCWYGNKIMFGLGGSYSRLEKEIRFWREDNLYSGGYINHGNYITLFRNGGFSQGNEGNKSEISEIVSDMPAPEGARKRVRGVSPYRRTSSQLTTTPDQSSNRY